MAAFWMSCVAAEMALWSGIWPTVVLFLGFELFTLIIEEAWASDLIVSRADFSLFRDLCERIPWDAILGRGEVQESWLKLQDHLLQAQEWSIGTNRKTGGSTGGLCG